MVQATAKKILENAFLPGDRYFRSGDLFVRDRQGYFRFVDRIGDTFRSVIWTPTYGTGYADVFCFDTRRVGFASGTCAHSARWKGQNVSTTEVEHILTSFQGVLEANVYGVAVPGTDGQACMAACVLADDVDWDGLYRYLKKQLPEYAIPIFVRVLPKIEVTATFRHTKVPRGPSAWRHGVLEGRGSDACHHGPRDYEGEVVHAGRSHCDGKASIRARKTRSTG